MGERRTKATRRGREAWREREGRRWEEIGGSQANHEQAKRREVISGHRAQRGERKRREMKEGKRRGGEEGNKRGVKGWGGGSVRPLGCRVTVSNDHFCDYATGLILLAATSQK